MNVQEIEYLVENSELFMIYLSIGVVQVSGFRLISERGLKWVYHITDCGNY